MSAGTIVGIVAGAVVLIALIAFAVVATRRARLDSRRRKAGELRHQADERRIQVEASRASAAERAARAQRAQAEAEERTAQARQDSALAQKEARAAEEQTAMAREHYDRARAVDPDSSDTGEEEAHAVNEEPASQQSTR